MKKRTYVTYKEIREIKKNTSCNYLILYGGRNDGKSYAAKEEVIRNYMENGEKFTYLRRNDSDLKNNAAFYYFADFINHIDGKPNKIEELTEGKYNTLTEYRKELFLANIDEEGSITKGEKIGYCHALSLANKRYKSLQFPDVSTILFEEFCTTDGYLPEEAKLFMNYCSTIFRDRKGLAIMVGNTVSRNNAYFRAWEMYGILKQQPGSVDCYKYTEEDATITVAVYYTQTVKSNKMFFGTASRMITKGEFDVNAQPRLTNPFEEYTVLYKMIFHLDKNNCFTMRFLQRGDTCVWYVTPKTTPIKPTDRIISINVHETPLYTRGFIPINDSEKLIFDYLKRGLIVYSDNLTGTEFKRCMKDFNTAVSG